MIARLEGVLAEHSPTRVVVDVGGVGYELHVPLSTFAELPDPGKVVALHVYTHANEGGIQLFGFHSLAERAAFELLLKANRVGPRLAQTVLSSLSPPDLLAAIRGENVAALRAVPGIGTKMAQRILLELHDRVDGLAAQVKPAESSLAEPEDSAREQTLSALLNLGYARADAERVIADALAEQGREATLETLVRASLRRLVR
ncbi:MAG: Holliday junction branch migration protein RuvA [Myxococcota bacterium]|nr:Holliday junction branch migration protein RuvA [Deltaproteobacteria bacterium]MCP4244018.1 Holliday junction branch migration protein RuvA [bacterium]MDP6073859.1 Holliday junction branch migration protein RuvA [Myxococcota bacterium]MDP6243184.1 Holliday junction branch migration protein RuvA [Myxococcota bacterium]MDP7073624.1 Holliday junction branch migration protein RuvA [Myxococcota bacterium]